MVSSQKDKANVRWQSEREGTFYFRKIPLIGNRLHRYEIFWEIGKICVILHNLCNQESVQRFLRALLRERSDYGQRRPCLSKVSEELFKN